jgi:hypothetical protein
LHWGQDNDGRLIRHVQPIKDDAIRQLPKGCFVTGMVAPFADNKGYVQVYNAGSEVATIKSEANVALVSALTRDELERCISAGINRHEGAEPKKVDDVITLAQIHKRVRELRHLTALQRQTLTQLLLARRAMFVNSLGAGQRGAVRHPPSRPGATTHPRAHVLHGAAGGADSAAGGGGHGEGARCPTLSQPMECAHHHRAQEGRHPALLR